MIEGRIISGKAVLQKFLQSESSTLAKAPILIISSGVAEHGSSSATVVVDSVDDACRKAQFLTSMQMGLRTVPARVTSAFPTLENVNSHLEMAKRTGATTILGVGSGAAMDLAKAVIQKRDSVRGLLVPSTYGAIVASNSQYPILLDTNEQALIVQQQDDHSSAEEASVVIETDSLANTHERDAAWACLAIGMDSLYRRPNDPDGTRLVERGLKELDDDSDDKTHLVETLVDAGRALNYGLDEHPRSSPLALAASLIPSCFPSAPVLPFFASLLPGICHISPSSKSDLESHVYEKLKERESDVPSLASMVIHADSAQSVPTLLSHVRSNQALWKCFDIEDHALEAILKYSLSR